MKSRQHVSGREADQPPTLKGGIASSPICAREPYEALDDLMVVIEQLCPRWPRRGTFKADGLWLL
jgi:hypothetical protein